MKNKDKIFEILKTLAISHQGVKSSSHAAAIVKKGKIISFGINEMKSHPFQKKFSKNESSIYFHSETRAIYNALKKLHVQDLKNCELYVVRAMKNGQISHSCPCQGCMSAINTFGIKSVYFSDRSGELQCL